MCILIEDEIQVKKKPFLFYFLLKIFFDSLGRHSGFLMF